MLIKSDSEDKFWFCFYDIKDKKKKKSITPIAGEDVGKRIRLNISGGKIFCSICLY